MAHDGVMAGVMLKRIKATICLQHFDRFHRLSSIDKAETIAMIDEIGIECAGAFPLGNRGVMPALEEQSPSEVAVRFR